MQLSLSSCLKNSNRGFTPLRFAPDLWLDASDSSTLYDSTVGGSLVSPDGAIARWEDKSGNGNHASQSTGVSQPLRKAAVVNGKDVVRFDGANDFMLLPDFLAGSAGTIFVVKKSAADPPASEPGSGALIQGWGTSGLRSHDPYQSDGNIYHDYGSLSRYNAGNPSLDLATFHLQTIISSGSEWTMRLNASVLYTTGTNTVSWWTAPRLGIDVAATYTWAGDAAEIISFPTSLSADNIAEVELYLNRKWAIY